MIWVIWIYESEIIGFDSLRWEAMSDGDGRRVRLGWGRRWGFLGFFFFFFFFFLNFSLINYFNILNFNCVFSQWHKCCSHISTNKDPIFVTSSFNGLLNEISDGCMKLK